MGILDNTAASITVTSGTKLGTISEAPTISYTVRDTNPGQYFGVNHYLDRTTLWFGAIQFDVESYESNVTKTNTFTVSSATWIDIYDGPHTIILRTENGTGLRSQATVSFIRTGNPEPKPDPEPDPEPEQPYLPPTTINPVNPPVNHPTYSDNEIVKMGVLRRIRNSNGEQEVKYVPQRTSQNLVYQNLFIENGQRYRNGYLVIPGYNPDEQVTFVDARNDSEKWSWIKTTLPNGKIIFISTTFGPSEYIYPLSEIHVTLGGVKYILRNLTQKEWLSIDKSTLEKIDFGNPDNNLAGGSHYTKDYIITRTPTNETSGETYDFLRNYSDTQYNSWIKNTANHENKSFLTMTYVSDSKARVTGWDKGWSYGSSMDYDYIRSETAWIPVLELANTDPIIDLPDKRNNDPTVNI